MTSACKKYANLAPSSLSSFNVTTNGTEFHVSDTVVFSFSAEADQIVFYSGEGGRNYVNRKRLNATGINKLNFSSAMGNGSLLNKDSLRLMITSNLKSYDSVGVMAAKWQDITERNTKWPTSLTSIYTTVYTPSDSIDITDFNGADSVNIAFKVLGKKDPLYAQRWWRVNAINILNSQSDGTIYSLNTGPYGNGNSNVASTPTYSGTSSIPLLAYAGLFEVNIKNNPPPVSLTDATQNFNSWDVGTYGINYYNSPLVIKTSTNIYGCNNNGVAIRTSYPVTFNPGPSLNNEDNEDWLITGPVNLKLVNPDQGVIIKNPLNLAFTNFTYVIGTPGTYATYKYIFSKPGIYNVVFVGQNRNNDKVEQVVRQMQITVTP